MVKKLTRHQQIWAQEEARIRKIIKKLELKGVYFKKSPIPEKKSRITKLAIAKISSLTFSDIASQGYVKVHNKLNELIETPYKPKRRSPKRKGVYDVVEEQEKLKKIHVEAYKRYRQKLDESKKEKELTHKKEVWKPAEKEETVTEETVYDIDNTKGIELPSKEEIVLPDFKQKIEPNNEKNIKYNETDYDVNDLPYKDCVEALIVTLMGGGFNSLVRNKLLSIIFSLDTDEKAHAELNGRIANAEGFDLEVASELHESGEPDTVLGDANTIYFILTGKDMDFALRMEMENLYYEDAGWSEWG